MQTPKKFKNQSFGFLAEVWRFMIIGESKSYDSTGRRL